MKNNKLHFNGKQSGRREFLKTGFMGTLGLSVGLKNILNPNPPQAAHVNPWNGLQDWIPPVQLNYKERDGIYMLTYGSTTESPRFEQQMEVALSQPYIKGISHYMCWRQLEPRENEYDWRQLDLVFDRVKKYGKYCIIGFQAGVMAPLWLFDRPELKTVDFIHANPGWTSMSTIKIPVEVNGNTETLSRMALPWDTEYTSCLAKILGKIAERYDGESCITKVSICGPSASAGVEANFNVEWNLSRAANPNFDTELEFTLDKYCKAWKKSIDDHLRIFQKSPLGIGLHDQTSASGYDGENILYYPENDKMNTAREIRDYFLEYHEKLRGTWGTVRNCGLHHSESWWGNPDTIADKPASNFTALQWEVRNRANIGYEAAQVNNRAALGGGEVSLSPEVFTSTIHNGITGYGRYLEIKVPDIVDKMMPYAPYRPILEEAARIMKAY